MHVIHRLRHKSYTSFQLINRTPAGYIKTEDGEVRRVVKIGSLPPHSLRTKLEVSEWATDESIDPL